MTNRPNPTPAFLLVLLWVLFLVAILLAMSTTAVTIPFTTIPLGGEI